MREALKWHDDWQGLLICATFFFGLEVIGSTDWELGVGYLLPLWHMVDKASGDK
jgi:hypothetical protein